MTDERPDSLAAQAASWVPPWERSPREPDRDFQAAAEADAEADDAEADDVEAEGGADPTPAPDSSDLSEEGEPEVDVGQAAEGEDAGEAAEGEDDGEPGEVAPIAAETDEPGTVDEPAGAAEPVDEPGVLTGPEVEVPDAVDVSDDTEVDLKFAEEPAIEEPAIDEPPAGEPPGEPEAAVAAAIPAQAVPRRKRKKDPEPEPAEEPVEVVPMEDGELRAALEAILLVVDEPVAELQLAQIVEEPVERIGTMLEDISARYTAAGHGFDLRRAAGGWRLYTRPEYAAYVERFVLDGQSVRLTQAALETLAVVAYKQPVTRSRISAIRGVNCDGVMRTLATRGLIEECGTEPETGAHLYRTTTLFLEKLGLNSVDQLPPLAPFLPDDVEEVIDASG